MSESNRPAVDASANKPRLLDLSLQRGVSGVQQLRFGFVGRRKSRTEAIRSWRSGLRVLIIHGMGGLGKTALCTEIAPILARHLARTAGSKGNGSILALDGRTAGRRSRPIESLWEEVAAAESDEAWQDRLAEFQPDGVTGEATAAAVLELAGRRGALLVYLDDAESLQTRLGSGDEGNAIGQWVDAEITAFWLRLATAAAPDGRFGLLASSRYLPNDGEGPTLPVEAHLPLPVMSRMDVVKHLRWFPTLSRASAEDWEWLATEVIDGHPRTIEYLAELARIRATQVGEPGRGYRGNDWRGVVLDPLLPSTRKRVDADLLLPRVWEAIGDAAREHLGRLSLLVSPAPWPLVEHSEVKIGTGRALIRAGLLSPFLSPDGRATWWAPHRLVVELAETRWTGDRVAAHRMFGEWLAKHAEEDRGTNFLTAAAEHLLLTGDGDVAWATVGRLILALRHVGWYQQALRWLERVLAAEPSGTRRALALTFWVQIGRMAGEPPAQAESLLQEAEGLVEREDLSFVLDELGKLHSRQGRLQDAAKVLSRSVQVGSEAKGELHPDVAASLTSWRACFRRRVILREPGRSWSSYRRLRSASMVCAATTPRR